MSLLNDLARTVSMWKYHPAVIIRVGSGFAKLHRITRWNRLSNFGLERSVFEHSVTCRLLMANYLKNSYDASEREFLCNAAKHHDFLEVYSGDIGHDFKDYIPHYERIEQYYYDEHMKEIKSDFPELCVDDVNHFMRYYKFIDDLDAALEAEYMMQRNRSLNEQLERIPRLSLAGFFPGERVPSEAYKIIRKAAKNG